jgi:FKBP-type peptidyl-prolyl cis-trans isomerase SlyD
MSNTNATVADGMVVSLEYTLRLDDGQVIDSTEDHPALEFLQGVGQIIPGLEQELYGMSIGDGKKVTVTPEDGYGVKNPEAVQTVPKNVFPNDMELTPGQGLHLRDEQNNVFTAYVVDIQPDAVVLDMNHPLAGQTLNFDVKVAGLRQATPEELDHGHVHGEGHPH